MSKSGTGAVIAPTQVYIFANGGSTWSQGGSEWHTINNDGYCVSGRGPCGSSLWYLQWSSQHNDCGYDEWGVWDWPSQYELLYNGHPYAWIDGSTGTMWGADYEISYGQGGFSVFHSTVNQRNYFEAWAPLTNPEGVFQPDLVFLSDGWGNQVPCNDDPAALEVEFDEIKLEY